MCLICGCERLNSKRTIEGLTNYQECVHYQCKYYLDFVLINKKCAVVRTFTFLQKLNYSFPVKLFQILGIITDK